MLEKSVEQTSEDEAKRVGAWPIKLAFISGRGWPDHTILMHGGRIAFIEFKREDNSKYQPLQKWVGRTLLRYGFRYAVCKTNAEVRAFYKEWLGD